MRSPSQLSHSTPFLGATLWLSSIGLSLSGIAQSGEKLSYNLDVRPILSDNCFHCHGQDANKREAELRLDNSGGATRDLGGYAALVPGNPDESELYLRITNDLDDERMPPPDSNRSLTEEQRNTLRKWIEQGGQYDTHWAFVPPRKSEIPDSRANPIDAFIKAKLKAESLEFSPPATAATWLRRVSFDLTGLPPSLEEIGSFENAVLVDGEAAYEHSVDRLLESPHYGERQASDWMDAARYADTHGFNNDSTRSMWRWRDWVIDAFNQNLPYDQFITEQLAGDLLPSPTLEQRIATGFNRNHGINSEGGIIDEEYRIEYVADRVRTVGMVWMGLTTECARCHDHKYDPLSQEDYYRLFAFFNNVNELGEDGRVANAVPMIPAPTREQSLELKALEDALQETTRVREQFLTNHSFDFAGKGLTQLQESIQKSTLPEPAWKISGPDASESSPLETTQTPPLHVAPGIRGNALLATTQKEIGAVKAKTNVFEKETDAFTLMFWMRPDPECPGNAPLVSNARYEANPSSSNYGKGWDIRLIDGEIQFAVAKRFPAYSATLRTRAAKIRSDEWRHLTVAFTGRTKADNAYTPASRFHIYIDGEEARIDITHDGLQDMPKEDDEPTLIGTDWFPDGNRFVGRIDEIQQFGQALNESEIRGFFDRDALEYALSRLTKKIVATAQGDVDFHDLSKAGKTGSILQQSNENSGLSQPSLPILSEKEKRWISAAALGQAANDEWKALNQTYYHLRSELLQLERSLPTTMVMQEMPGMRETFVLNRGNYDSHGKRVEPGVPEDWIASWPEGAPKDRLGLAQWLTQSENPLTARVVVNRFWQQSFGTGLVKTSEDFGVQSEYPSHPQLLDWLAVDFQESGWDVKRLFKQIVLSKTYRQQSHIPSQLESLDPENRLLARGPRFRLPAEAIRDQALSVSGLLNPRIGGPSVRPYQPEGFYNNTVVGADYPSTKWIQNEDEDLYRRSLYTFWKRTVPHPFMTTFDAPNREVCTVRRSPTNTPLQALALMNDPTFVEASRVLAEKILSENIARTDARLRRAFQLATGRIPDPSETSVLRQALEEMKASFRSDPSEAEAFLEVGESKVSINHSQIEIAAYTAIMSLILNLDETLTKG